MNITRYATMLALMLSLSACAEPASQHGMTAHPGAEELAAANPRLKKAVTVRHVSGGQETNPMWTSQVDNNGFKEALIRSLADLGYIAKEGAPKYTIDATLQSLDQPVIGFTFDVTAKVNYAVESNGVRTEYPITATGTATGSDAFSGVKRLRIANERAIQKNISLFIAEFNKRNK